jgi:hypothetical protein
VTLAAQGIPSRLKIFDGKAWVCHKQIPGSFGFPPKPPIGTTSLTSVTLDGITEQSSATAEMIDFDWSYFGNFIVGVDGGNGDGYFNYAAGGSISEATYTPLAVSPTAPHNRIINSAGTASMIIISTNQYTGYANELTPVDCSNGGAGYPVIGAAVSLNLSPTLITLNDMAVSTTSHTVYICSSSNSNILHGSYVNSMTPFAVGEPKRFYARSMTGDVYRRSDNNVVTRLQRYGIAPNVPVANNVLAWSPTTQTGYDLSGNPIINYGKWTPTLITNNNIAADANIDVTKIIGIRKMDFQPLAGPYSPSETSWRVVAVNQSTPAPYTLNLPATPLNGDIVTVKDAKGDANSNNITINGNGKTIDGASSSVISVNWGSITLIYNSIEWNIIEQVAGATGTSASSVFDLYTGTSPYAPARTSWRILVINQTIAGPITINLPNTSLVAGDLIDIKDGKGDAATNNITISGNTNTIDGSSVSTIAINYGARSLVWNGTEWNIL